MSDDLLSHAEWHCARSRSVGEPVEVTAISELDWLAATVPGTAAGAIRATQGEDMALSTDFDDTDWWFRTTFRSGGDGPWVLRFEGLATDADVWLNGVHVLHSENMFRRHLVPVGELGTSNELVMRFRALSPRLADRRPRARWRTRLVGSQGLRWWRTSLLGHIRWPGYSVVVGPWRSVTLHPRGTVEFEPMRAHTRVVGEDGVVEVDVRVEGADLDQQVAELTVGEFSSTLRVERDGGSFRVRGEMRVPGVQLWWPHSHGDQPLYEASLAVGGHVERLGRVGFRNIQAVRSDDGFTLVVNGERVFGRGVCWVSPDVLSLNPDTSTVRASLNRLRAAGLNMVRLTGTSAYESEDFWDLCDELGIMVWQDAMLATLDPPDDPGFVGELSAELRDLFAGLRGRPSLAVLCGGSETEQQATFMGLSSENRRIRILEEVVPDVVHGMLPDIPYVTSSPSGGALPTHVGSGVAHYFGVGGYRRPLSDVRSSGVRFASECLALSNPPEAESVRRHFGSASVAGHDPRWKRGVPRDAATSWDFEDVRDHYVREIFGLDPEFARRRDPEWSLDLGRAAVAALAGHVFTEWRRAGSRCAGGLILSARDVVPGAGWGIVDSDGGPKSILYALKEVCSPQALLVCDEALDGLWVHLVNDGDRALPGRIEICAYGVNGRLLISEVVELTVAARQTRALSVDQAVGGFRDLTDVFGFGPATYDCLRARWLDATGRVVSERTVLTRGQMRPRVHDVGLTATATATSATEWKLSVSTRELAQWVAIDVEGFDLSASWFHLAPGTSREVVMTAVDQSNAPLGQVRALNSVVVAEVSTP